MISKRILEKVKESRRIYHIYVEGDYLYMIRYGDYTNEIPKTKMLRAKGVNFAGPINQIKFDERQVVVEEYFAKGKTFESFEDKYRFKNLDSEKVLDNYCVFFKPYLDELKLRAEASQQLYDKLFRDIKEMNQENLTLDACSLGNLFFDEHIGFSIIDAYPGTSLPDISYFFWLIRGNIPSIICDDNNQLINKAVPASCYHEFMVYFEAILSKFMVAARKNNINYDFESLHVLPNIVTVDLINELIKMEYSHSIII